MSKAGDEQASQERKPPADAAAEWLVRNYAPTVRAAIARRMGSDSDDLEDLECEVWLRIIAIPCAKWPTDHIVPWLRTVCRNVCVDTIRDRQRRRKAAVAAAAQVRVDDEPVADELLSKRERDALWSAVGDLPSAVCDVIVAHSLPASLCQNGSREREREREREKREREAAHVRVVATLHLPEGEAR